MIKRLAIVGAGKLGRQIAHHARDAVEEFSIVGFYDDMAGLQGDVIGRVNDLEKDYAEGRFDCVSLGLGYNVCEFRSAVLARVIGKVPLAKIISRHALIDEDASIEEGCAILRGALIDQDVKIGPNCFISLGSSISHETEIGANTYISPHVTVCGNCKIGSGVFLGAGCILRDGVDVCDGAIVGCGAVVVKDITLPLRYIGNPARAIVDAGIKRI